MEPKIPEWITADFLQQSLQSHHRYRDITITDFTTSLAAPAGNNYGSLVIRVIIDCKLRDEEQKISVIIKGPVTEGVFAELLKDNSEPSFYDFFLPEVLKLFPEVPDKFAPDSFLSPIPSAVVLEDLRVSGYLMADRTKQLDFEHCLLYMKAAASFHAASMALHKRTPEIIETVCVQPMYCDRNKAKNITQKMLKWALTSMASHVKDKRISQILKDTSERFWRMLIDIHKPHHTLNSLIQGDPWTTNMMFKYDPDGKVSDIKLIDFQILTFGPPAHDLVFFIWVSANNDVKRERIQELYSNYYTELNSNLRTLNCSEIDFDCFMDTIKLFSPFALVSAAMSPCLLDPMPADFNAMCEKDMDSNKGQTAKEDNPFNRYYTESFCRTDLPQMVEHLEAEGVFDYLESKLYH